MYMSDGEGVPAHTLMIKLVMAINVMLNIYNILYPSLDGFLYVIVNFYGLEA